MIRKRYITIKTYVIVECMRSDLFNVKIEVYQGSVVSPLLLAVVMMKMIPEVP